ncbi:uncharacterized protein [Setaria viridis]|uniref:uncharacterized protein n=1 Tax=Setaria viridis TaxID=4556 RepID=UPI001493BAE9|nr:uncharacterized protein LOC117861831 [Setaria viridis]
MLARFMAVPHNTYLILKMPAPNGVLSIYGDIETSYKCDMEVVQLAEALEYSTNATAMLAKAQKVGQNQLMILEIEPMTTTLQPEPKFKKICLGLEDPSKMALIGSDLSPK